MAQQRKIFDKDTLLDLTVNIIPLGIMLFFLVLFVPMVYGPFSWDSTYSILMLALIVAPFVLLAILTYFSALAIEGDAHESEGEGHMTQEHHDRAYGTDEDEEQTDSDGESTSEAAAAE
ncbi:DUF6684 family protein [Haloarchaeobius amylolyticus]|uniref:DUF6684 family protein n=1 Tax=Haloarchaeobius amylolyticus TaxID=1198296 RepID=UPI002271243D|nr:DUF6684 family protein [Haloarchaeobius amylolyticus]